jgi:hypothetical protein
VRKLLWTLPLSALALGALVFGLLAWNLFTFHRLTNEAPIAALRFIAIEPQIWQVELRSGDFCETRKYRLFGDEWRLDARFLKWKPWANLLGMDAMYRLERISGRYRAVSDENARKHFAYDIGRRPAIDLARYAEYDMGGWVPVDTVFGSSVYETIDPDYRYVVYRAQSGLLVRKERITSAHYEDGALVIHIEKDCSHNE